MIFKPTVLYRGNLSVIQIALFLTYRGVDVLSVIFGLQLLGRAYIGLLEGDLFLFKMHVKYHLHHLK